MNADRKLVIQRLPTGLLDMLGMQSTGENPNMLSPTIAAVLDTTDLFLIDRLRRRIETTAVIAATGTFIAGLPTVTQLGPAPGEQWMLYQLTATSVALAAASSMKLSWSISRNSLGGTGYIDLPQTFAAAETIAMGRWFDRPMILRPGDQLGVACNAITGAPAVAVFVQAFYVPIRI